MQKNQPKQIDANITLVEVIKVMPAGNAGNRGINMRAH